MFYNKFKQAFDQIDPIKRPFARNIVLGWLFYFLAAAAIDLKPQNSVSTWLLLSAVCASIVNISFGFVISRIKQAYSYYLFAGVGGLTALSVLFIGAFEMLAWKSDSLSIFSILAAGISILLIYIGYVSIDRQMLRDYIVFEKPIYTWNIDKDIYTAVNMKSNLLLNLVRMVVAPIAPALGMALARSFEGDQEWVIIGFMMLLLALIVSAGYIRFFALGLKLFNWSRMLDSRIEIVNFR